MTKAASGLPVSVQTRLNTHARIIGADPNFVLTRYVAERFLYRLSRSIYAERFVLKGALLMLAWLGETLRPTRDVDFLGYGDLSADALSEALTTICTTPVEPSRLIPSASNQFVRKTLTAAGGQPCGLPSATRAFRCRSM